MSVPISARIHIGAGQADPGNLIQPDDRAGERGSLLGGPDIQRGDISAHRIDAARHRAQRNGDEQ